jgi:hypothetical protein
MIGLSLKCLKCDEPLAVADFLCGFWREHEASFTLEPETGRECEICRGDIKNLRAGRHRLPEAGLS